MDPPAVRKFLRQVGQELKDLGPFERHKALAEIRSDIVDLAMDGHAAAPEKEVLDSASKSMPSPREVAQAYLVSARPPILAIKASIGVNLLLSLGSTAAGAWLFASLFAYQGSRALPALFTMLLIVSGLFGLLVYGLALVHPGSAMRWRFAVLPAIVIAVVFDAVLGTVAVVNLNWPQQIGVFLPIATFFGGSYSIAYAHGQLPRLSLSEVPVKKRGDYFRILGWYLRDLDRPRRKAIVAELRQHAVASGTDVGKLGPHERDARIAEILGPPDEIAAGYFREAATELSRRQKAISNVLMAPAMIGITLGAMLLWWGLSAATSYSLVQDLTLLGLVGSAGLLAMSIAALAGLLHVRRAPMHWPDVAPPTAAYALTAVLIIAAVFGGLPTGGIVKNTVMRSYTIDSVHYEPDGSLDVYWTTWSYAGSGSPLGVPTDARTEGSTITHLDPSRQVVSTEGVPQHWLTGVLLAFDHVDDTWIALYPEGFAAWGATNIGGNFDSLDGWQHVDGRISGWRLAVSWLAYDWQTGSIRVSSDSFTLPYHTDEVAWERTVAAPRGQNPWSLDSRVTLGENRTLVTVSLSEDNSSLAHSDARSYLFDEYGGEISNISLANEAIALNGTDDRLNGTAVYIDGSRYLAGAFWIIGRTENDANGTASVRTWAVRIDANDGSSRMYELRRLTLPYLKRGDFQPADGDPWYQLAQGTETDTDSILIVSGVAQGVVAHSSMGGLTEEVTSGNVSATRLMADGSFDFTAVLYNLTAGYQWLFIGTLISMYGGSPAIFVPGFSSVDTNGRMRVRAYTVAQPSHIVHEVEMTVGLAETMVFYSCLLQSVNGGFCVGKGVGQGTVELAGQAVYEDRGLFEWRSSTPGATAKAPAIIRLDANAVESTITLLAPLDRPPDTLAGLLTVTLAAVFAVLVLALGYLRLRSWRIQKRSQGED